MRNAGLDEAQDAIKIAGRNINNLRYVDDTTLIAESEELKRLLMKVKEENEKTYKNKSEKMNKMAIRTFMSIIILSVNRLNSPTKRQRLAE